MIAGFQMGLVAFALLPVFSRPVTTTAAVIFMIPLLAGFLRDWLVVCGYVEVNHFQQTRWDRLIGLLTTKLLPVLLRFVIGIAGIFLFYSAATVFFTGPQTVSATQLYLTGSCSLLELWGMAIAALLIVCGIITRIAALSISLLLAGTLTSWNSSPGLFLVFSCAVTLMLTGSGLLSTWHPEDALLLERQGRSIFGGSRPAKGG
jgi:CDP-diacylglycerol--glycerol-3-phosphate 3-phosphatidyltransferase